MSFDGEKETKKAAPGAPAWMVTFSDLMTLLLTFFVLLLSMANTDQPKFEKAVQSLHDAFRGSRVFGSPVSDYNPIEAPFPVEKKFDNQGKVDASAPQSLQTVSALPAELLSELQSCLANDVENGFTKMAYNDNKILLHYPAETTFDSGSDQLKKTILPSLISLAGALSKYKVNIVISGYTDNVPIATSRFRSNWDLSSARAVSVAHILLDNGDFEPERMEVVGHADAFPIVPNDTPENRAINRRVEIAISPTVESEKSNIIQQIMLESEYKAPDIAPQPKIEGMEQEN